MINKSFHLIRTNTALTTNVKVVVNENYDMFLESIESDKFLNQDRFKNFHLNKDNLLNEAIPEFFKNVPEDIAYAIKYDNDQSVMFRDFERQFDSIYFSGSQNVSDIKHDEEFEYFAPLHVNTNNMPSNFIIMRLDGPGKINLRSLNFKEEVIDNLKVVNIFDMENSNLGRFMDNNFKNKYFPTSPLELDFREFEFSRWNGIDYLSGGFSSKSFFLFEMFNHELPFYEFEKFMTDGFKKNSIIYPNLINLTFLFNDTPATPDELRRYSINRYLGFYIDKMDLVETVTPFKTYQLITGGDIQNNVFFDFLTNESYDPIEGGWKADKEYYIFNGGKFHYLTRTLIGTNQYDYKIISDTVFDTVTNALHVTDLFNTANTQPYTIETIYNTIDERTELFLSDGSSFISTLPVATLDSGDVFLIEINNKQHVLKYDDANDVFYINTDYRIDSNTDKIKYWIGGEDSEFTTEVTLGIQTKQNPPPIFKICRLDFTEICDFDHDLKETGFAGYEYETHDGLIKTSEVKMYANDHETTSVEPDLITDNPISSEYIASDEYFALGKDNNLLPIWRKNPIICKWGFSGSISHNDYPYKINNQISNLNAYNRAPDPRHIGINRWNSNLDYFYTHGNPTGSYVNHSLHLEEEFLNLADYTDSDYDYFSKVFEAESTVNDGFNDIIKNTYKYSVFNGGNADDAASCVFRGTKFKMYDVSNILKEGDDIKEFTLIESTRYNDYKFSIVFGSRRYNVFNKFLPFSGAEPEMGDSWVDVYVNHKYKNVLIHIGVNSIDPLLETYQQRRDVLYAKEGNVTGSTDLSVQALALSNVFNMLNSVNDKNRFDEHLHYWVIEEDGSFDNAQLNNKLTYNSTNLPPFYLTAEYPEQFEVKLESLLPISVVGPTITTNQPLSFKTNNQPYARKFEYSKKEVHARKVDTRSVFQDSVDINRFNGQYMPIFRRIEIFKAFENNADEVYGNYLFNTDLTNFGIIKEQKLSKVNRFEILLKLRNTRNTASVYPMVDEFGYFFSDIFLFKSTWDDAYYTETQNNFAAPAVIPEGRKTTLLAPEFIYSTAFGTFNMKEHKTFLGSKGMDVEDQITIDEKSITFLEDSVTGQQSSTSGSEVLNTDFNFNTLKDTYHTIEQKKLQSTLEREEITKWVIKVDAQKLLKDYLYSSIKKARTFEDIINGLTKPNSVNLAIGNYIDSNLFDRFEIERVDFYVQYFLIEDDPSLMRYDPGYTLTTKQNKMSNIGNAQQTTDISVTGSAENNNIEIEYTQTKNSLDYKFDYYFDIIFKRA